MPLTLYYHPLASYCHKVLIALYEAGTDFDARIVDLGDPGEHAQFLDLWPVGKMPVLHDSDRNETMPETSIIIEYLDLYHPGSQPMLPRDERTCLDARLWDRFFDLYVHDPMQRLVFDRLRPENRRDSLTVEEATARLATAYTLAEKRMAGRRWAVGDDFTIADCAAAPALFYAGIIVPFADDHPALSAYFERLLERPSYRRALVEASPFFGFFPFRERMPQRFLELSNG